jgi:hypothetical protein
MQRDAKDESKSNPIGRQGDGSEQQGGFARNCNYPTQAKRRLEWATRGHPLGNPFTITKQFTKTSVNGVSVTKVTVTKH